CFEPTIDYCVVKFPRWPFDKFVYADNTLGTQMKATGEVMAIDNSFEGALMKAVRGCEIKLDSMIVPRIRQQTDAEVKKGVARTDDQRLFHICEALRRGIMTIEEIHEVTTMDTFFLHKFQNIIDTEKALATADAVDAALYLRAKKMGFLDKTIEQLSGKDISAVKRLPVYKMVDTCAAEFEAETPYYYSTYDEESEVKPASGKKKVLVLGSGPIRIGQGIEFDYCCVHASYALEGRGFETIMVNCNPETVSTDYDTSDRLYFEPLTYEDVMDIVDVERPDGVVVTLGGQTPLKLARVLADAGVRILGTQPDAIDLAEDRERFSAVLDDLGILYPAAGEARSFEEACRVAARIGFPLLVRPSYVLGGRGMMIAYDEEHLRTYMAEAVRISPDYPVYLDRFLEGAIECDVDALCDGDEVYIGGILEHIEEAGIHSGDSATCIPPFSFSEALVQKLRDTTARIALALGVRGLVNVQYAIQGDTVYVIEANPRASRTVPFISKATGVPLAKCAACIMAGERIADLGLPADDRELDWFCMKEAVMPWGRFPGADVVLGPEMKSTGEVMGIAKSYPEAYAKTQLAISYKLPTPDSGKVFISVNDRDKRNILSLARILRYLGFEICSTEGTARVLAGGNVSCEVVRKFSEPHPNIGDMIAGGEIAFMINTPFGQEARGDGYRLRTEAVRRGVTCITALSAANAFVAAVEALEAARRDQTGGLEVIALQDLPQYEV
ncbi:carbamoyl-phosphate synthase large subunit, partial [Enorma sp.]|uniref:carbamoyl-phosphate synthase large subunit n=1 Tax=Enorma sp. TaxID=1920692 RepID=UPI003AB6B0C7